MTDEGDDLAPTAKTRGLRVEIRTVVAIVLLVVVLGGLYVAVFGSPARNRAAIDNINTDPYRAQTPPPHH